MSLSKKSSFVSFRNTILTRILQPVLDGKARVVFICCVISSGPIGESTRKTLEFALHSKQIKYKANINYVQPKQIRIMSAPTLSHNETNIDEFQRPFTTPTSVENKLSLMQQEWESVKSGARASKQFISKSHENNETLNVLENDDLSIISEGEFTNLCSYSQSDDNVVEEIVGANLFDHFTSTSAKGDNTSPSEYHKEGQLDELDILADLKSKDSHDIHDDDMHVILIDDDNNGAATTTGNSDESNQCNDEVIHDISEQNCETSMEQQPPKSLAQRLRRFLKPNTRKKDTINHSTENKNETLTTEETQHEDEDCDATSSPCHVEENQGNDLGIDSHLTSNDGHDHDNNNDMNTILIDQMNTILISGNDGEITNIVNSGHGNQCNEDEALTQARFNSIDNTELNGNFHSESKSNSHHMTVSDAYQHKAINRNPENVDETLNIKVTQIGEIDFMREEKQVKNLHCTVETATNDSGCIDNQRHGLDPTRNNLEATKNKIQKMLSMLRVQNIENQESDFSNSEESKQHQAEDRMMVSVDNQEGKENGLSVHQHHHIAFANQKLSHSLKHEETILRRWEEISAEFRTHRESWAQSLYR